MAVSLGMRYVDTAAYGEGRSELRYGEALKDFPRDSYVISTKVGVLLKLDGVHEVDFRGIGLSNLPVLDGVFDFSRDAVLRSLEQSLQRLRLDHVDILLLHVVPREHYRMAIDEGFPTLAELRSQGVVRAIGAGLTPLDLLLRFAREADFDCFMLPERYTLMEQPAIDEFLPICEERDIAVIIGAPYNNGRLLRRPAVHYRSWASRPWKSWPTCGVTRRSASGTGCPSRLRPCSSYQRIRRSSRSYPALALWRR